MSFELARTSTGQPGPISMFVFCKLSSARVDRPKRAHTQKKNTWFLRSQTGGYENQVKQSCKKRSNYNDSHRNHNAPLFFVISLECGSEFSLSCASLVDLTPLFGRRELWGSNLHSPGAESTKDIARVVPRPWLIVKSTGDEGPALIVQST